MSERLHVVAVALGSFGDVHPLLGVAREMARRGHAVDFLANPLYREAVERAGLRFHGVGERESFERAIDNPRMWTLTHGARMLAKVLILPYMREVYGWIEHNRRPNTVVIASAIAFGARIAQEKLGVPLATMLLQPSLVRSRESIPGLPLIPTGPQWQCLARPMRDAVMWGVDTLLFDPALAGGVNAFRRELGLPGQRRVFHKWLLSPELSVGLFPEWYAQPQSDWPPYVHCTGFPLYDEAETRAEDPALRAFLDAGDPPVVLTPGTAMRHARRFFRAGVEACGRIGRRALLLTHFPQHTPNPLPDWAASFDYAPFSTVLPRCAAIVHHGGIGTSAQALRAGIPQLISPFSYDQPDNAVRLRDLGVARTVFPKFFFAGVVARRLETLLGSDSIRAACAEAAERMRGSNGLAETADLVEGLAAQRAG